MLKNIAIFMVLFLLFVFPLYAQIPDSDNYRKAEQIDIIGIWKMSYQMVNPQFANNSLFFADFQIFEFEVDDFVKNISSPSDLPLKKIRPQLEAMDNPMPYDFVEPGMIEVKRSNKITDCIIVSVLTKDMKAPVRLKAPIMKKGDLILSYLDANKQMFMQRFLTKIKPPYAADKASQGY